MSKSHTGDADFSNEELIFYNLAKEEVSRVHIPSGGGGGGDMNKSDYAYNDNTVLSSMALSDSYETIDSDMFDHDSVLSKKSMLYYHRTPVEGSPDDNAPFDYAGMYLWMPALDSTGEVDYGVHLGICSGKEDAQFGYIIYMRTYNNSEFSSWSICGFTKIYDMLMEILNYVGTELSKFSTKEYVDSGLQTTLSEANEYSDSVGSGVLEESKAYTDSLIGDIESLLSAI